MTHTQPHQWMVEQLGLGRSLCLILDSENEREVCQVLLKTSSLEHYQSVYRETTVADLADAGPFMFLIDNLRNKSINDLFNAPQRNWGWLASIGKGDLSVLVRHWRDRLMVGIRPLQAIYRSHDNRVMSRAIEHLPQQAHPEYLGPAVSVCYWQGQRWAVANNPAPAQYPVPDDPLWLHVPAPELQWMDILQANAHRYLLAKHTLAYAQLAEHHDPHMWLGTQLALARVWGWLAPEHLEFLLIQSLKAPGYSLATQWPARTGESPMEHFERVVQMVKFWQEEGPL